MHHFVLRRLFEWWASIQAARALQGRGDLVEVLPPCYVNPVAAWRERDGQRKTRTWGLHVTTDGSSGSAKCEHQICGTGRKPDTQGLCHKHKHNGTLRRAYTDTYAHCLHMAGEVQGQAKPLWTTEYGMSHNLSNAWSEYINKALSVICNIFKQQKWKIYIFFSMINNFSIHLLAAKKQTILLVMLLSRHFLNTKVMYSHHPGNWKHQQSITQIYSVSSHITKMFSHLRPMFISLKITYNWWRSEYRPGNLSLETVRISWLGDNLNKRNLSRLVFSVHFIKWL